MSIFRVGMKVVCVRELLLDESGAASRQYLDQGGVLPEVGKVYEVRGIYTIPFPDVTGLFLVELRNPVMKTCHGEMEVPFNAAIFRPVVERKTDISVFQALLTPSKQGVLA